MRRSISFTIGSAVLAAVALVCWRIVAAASPPVEPAALTTPVTGPAPVADRRTNPDPAVPVAPPAPGADANVVAGVVLRPDGAPAANARVRLFRLRTAWPQWLHDPIQDSVTLGDGAFRFATERGPDLLVQFEHDDFAGDLVEASPVVARLELRLQRGFEVAGYVRDGADRPLAQCEVLLESGPSDTRRTLPPVKSNSLGRFRFANVAAGTVRVVARHPAWQPVSATHSVGAAKQLDLRLEKPTLRLPGQVLSAGTPPLPLAGAEVRAYPNVANLGLFEPIFAVTNVDGRFELTGIGRGNLHVEVRHPAFTTASRKLAIGQAPTPINFELVPKSEVSGLLRVPSDVLAAIKTPPILLLRADAGDISSCTVAADGKFRFPAPFSAGLATLELLAGPLAFARSAAASIQVRIDEAPKTDLDLEAVAPASLQGRVVDATGRPLADVQVFLTQREQIVNTLREAGTALLEVDFGKLRDQVTRTSVAEPERLIAVSAADGSFRIAGLPAGAVTLHALRAGFAGRRFDADVPALGTAERMDDVVLRRGCRIDGQVVRADRPQTGAVVSAIGDAGNATAVVDADGRFVLEDLPAGDYRLRARFSTLPTVEQMVVASEQAAATVQLKFAPFGRQVSGKVVDPEGQPIANAYVVVGGRGVPELTDAAGQFTVEVPKGRVELRAFLGDRRAQSTVPVGEADKSVTITLDPPPTATLRAQVLALPARRRPASVVLKITPLDEGGATTQVRRIDLTDEGMRDPWFPAGRARVTIGGEGYAPWSGEVELQPGEVQSLGEVVLEPACTLLGRVVDDGGRPVAGCTVFLGEEGDEMLLRPQLRSAADGTFKLTGVCMAASNLVAKAPGFATRVLPLQLPRDVLRRDLLPVVLDRGSMIEVTVSGGLTGDEGFVLLFHNGRQVAATDLDAAGRATFANCAVGDYVVRPFGDDQVRREVHVLATGRSYPVTLP